MIETHGLTKHFGDFVAVQDVSLSIQPGTLLALLGPNGAGKTTTIRMLTSILKPTLGSAIVGGFDVVKEAPQVRASVGVLTEQHGLYERMNGLEYLEFFGRIYRIPQEIRQRRARALMERFGMADVMERRIASYSKGMKQKIALVRALLHDPPVLLLDEPTSAMDPQSARLVRDAIRDLKNDQRTIVLTTHNLAEAESLADEIAIIRHGRIIAKGTQDNLTQRVVGNPQFEVRTATPLNGTVENISQFVNPLRVEDHCVQYETRDPDRDNPRVVKEMVKAGVDIVTISKVSRSLEDVYLGIVEEDEK
jgi:ABC-2 type transport system ATP-binding protein